MNRLAVNIVASLLVFTSQFAWSQQDLCSIYNDNIPGPRLVSQNDGLWSNPETWGGQLPTINDDVIVEHSVVLDSGESREIQIRGNLEIGGTLDAYASLLVCSGGQLTGSVGAIRFHVADDRAFSGNTGPGPVPGSFGFHPEDTGLWVVGGGTLDLTGPEVTSWVNAVSINGVFDNFQHGVSTSTAFQNGIANLAESPQGWQAGDQLLLVNEKGAHSLAVLTSISGTTVSYQAESDIVGNVLKIDGKSVHPKVANLTRRFLIESADVKEDDFNHRAHTVYLRGSYASIRNVELRNLGPRATLGRYPVHWHMAQDSEGGVFGSSIWQSVDDGGNRFVVPHIVNGITVADNVGFRAQGHGFFMEQIAEFDNVVTGNLSVDVRYGEELPNVDQSISSRTHHFWLRESNLISGNVAAGNNWDPRGVRSTAPAMDGLVILPSSKTDSTPLVTDFECLGCGGIGMWTAVPNTLFENPQSSYALTAAYRAWDRWNTSSLNSELINPLFLLNGSNEAFKESGDFADRNPWVSQIYINYGEILVSGGIMAGDIGVHAHYNAKFSMDGTTVNGHTLVDQTYWELTANLSNMNVDTQILFNRGYGRAHRISPGFARLTNLCLGADCNAASGGNFSGTFTGPHFAQIFELNSEIVVDPDLPYVAIAEPIPDSGFLKIPADTGAKFWSVFPVDSEITPSIRPIQERESKWKKNLNLYQGYLDGFAPGEYFVKLYSESNENSLIASGTASIHSGLISKLCLDGEVCTEANQPTLVVSLPSSSRVGSGIPTFFEVYAKDLEDGFLTDDVSWNSSIDGFLGNGSGFQQVLSDGFHTITVSVTDSDGFQASSDIVIGVGNFVTPASSSSTSTNTATLSAGVSVLVATAQCSVGADPHWQCGGSWTSPTELTADSFVAFCDTGASTYNGCSSTDSFKKFGDLGLEDAIGACVGVAIVDGSRNDCANARGPEGFGSHEYVKIVNILAVDNDDPAFNPNIDNNNNDIPDESGSPDENEPEVPVEPAVPVDEPSGNTGESTGESGEATDEETGNTGTSPDQVTFPGGVSVLIATLECTNESDPHWQCGGSWASPEDLTPDTFVAFCEIGQSSYNNCSSTDRFERFGNLESIDNIGACVGVTLAGGSRNDCANARGPEGFGSHEYVSIANILSPGPGNTDETDIPETSSQESDNSSDEPPGESEETGNTSSGDEEATNDTEEPANDTEESAPEAEESANGGEELGNETEEPGNEAQEPGNEAQEPGNEAQEPGNEAEEPGNEAEEPGNEAEEPGNEAENSDEGGTGSSEDPTESEPPADDSSDQNNESGNESEPTFDNGQSSGEQAEESEEGTGAEEEQQDVTELPDETEAEQSDNGVPLNDDSNDSPVESEDESVEPEVTTPSGSSGEPAANETQNDNNHPDEESDIAEETVGDSGEPGEPGETPGENPVLSEEEQNSSEEPPVESEVESPTETTEDESPTADQSEDPTVTETENDNGESEGGSSNTDESNTSSDEQVIEPVDDLESDPVSHEVPGESIPEPDLEPQGFVPSVVVKSGQVLFASGFITDVENNGTLIGGHLNGYIDNWDGTLINVILSDQALANGGVLVGSLSGTGKVYNAILDLTSVDVSVKISYGTMVDQNMLGTIGTTGLDLTGAITNSQDAIDTTLPLILVNAETQFSVMDLIKMAVDRHFGDSSTTMTMLNEDGLFEVSNDNLLEPAWLVFDSIFTTHLPNGIETLSNGNIVVIENGVAILVR